MTDMTKVVTKDITRDLTKDNRAESTKDTKKEVTINRMYKSRIFEMIFSDKKELLALYNAVGGTHYTDPDQLEINTLENAIYMSMHNDISFIIDSRLSLYEHQSTYSPNLPLRCLLYIADLLSAFTKDENLYGKKKVALPTPRFLIFFNGVEKQPENQVLKLSDVYKIPEAEPALELKAVMLNINPGNNEALKDACKALKDYAEYTSRVRRYAEKMPLEDAVERAIEECIREGILAEFLSRNQAEAKAMSIYEYDEERHMRQTREEGYEEGYEAGESCGYAKGEASGRVAEKDLLNRLNKKLIENSRMEDLVRATSDPEYQEKLIKELGLK